MRKKHQANHVGHMPKVTERNVRALTITTWITGIYFIVELGIGIYSQSITVISDAFHTFSAVGGTLLALIAGKIALRPADKTRTYGSFRAEIVGALFNGIFLLVMAGIVLWMGYQRLFNPIHLPTLPMLIAAFGGIVTEIIALKLLYGAQKGNLNVRGAFWHVLQTFIGSIIIIIAALVIRFTGFLAIDPLLGMTFGIVLIFASWVIIKQSLAILLEKTPGHIDVKKIEQELLALPEVADVHHVHAWTITSGKDIFSAHIKINDISKSQATLRQAHAILKDNYNFYFSTLQIESECLDVSEPKEIDISG